MIWFGVERVMVVMVGDKRGISLYICLIAGVNASNQVTQGAARSLISDLPEGCPQLTKTRPKEGSASPFVIRRVMALHELPAFFTMRTSFKTAHSHPSFSKSLKP